jgi:tRNA-splicing endonuclease subunit Sen34
MRADDAVKSKAQKAKALNASGAGGDKARLKREERGRKRAEAARTAALAAGADEAVVHKAYEEAIAALSAPVAKKEEHEHEVVLPAPTAENSNIFTVVAGTPVLPDLTPRTPATLASPAFPFPATLRDAAVADAFSALHERGLRMGLGPRFGGEYLVYPGDYLRYHAHFTSQVIVRDEPIRPAELVAWGRLGTGTKKAGLLCCWDDGGSGEEEAKGKGEVEFYSLEWANFG